MNEEILENKRNPKKTIFIIIIIVFISGFIFGYTLNKLNNKKNTIEIVSTNIPSPTLIANSDITYIVPPKNLYLEYCNGNFEGLNEEVMADNCIQFSKRGFYYLTQELLGKTEGSKLSDLTEIEENALSQKSEEIFMKLQEKKYLDYLKILPAPVGGPVKMLKAYIYFNDFPFDNRFEVRVFSRGVEWNNVYDEIDNMMWELDELIPNR